MRRERGKFILFDLDEFGTWLNTADVSRVIITVQNHHTWLPAYRHFNPTNHFDLLQQMEHSHIERGFAEIAQNLNTFPDGTVAVCRSMDKIPAGIKGANYEAICIEHVGNFDHGGDVMAPVHRDAIVRLNAMLCRRFRIQPNANTLIYHHWWDLDSGRRTNGAGNTKSCPGTNFFGGNTVGHAETNFIPLVNQALGTVTTVQPIPVGTVLSTGRVDSDTLNVRVEPHAGGKLIKKLYKGVTVNAYEMSGIWHRIHPIEAHWVNSNYLIPA